VKNKKLNVCQVSLLGNLTIIKENLFYFNKFYKNNYHYIICPKKEKISFKKKINDKNCEIIDEDKILPFNKFKRVANRYLKNKKYFYKIQPRLNWYYQQILKLTFVLNFIKKTNNPIIIWDADTIILKKIFFFKKNHSIYYGTTSEFYKPYYKTNKAIFGKLPEYFISSLCQFTSLTPTEAIFLNKKLLNLKKKNIDTGIWLTEIIFKSIASEHHIYNGSLFSEYEFIGQSNLLKNFKSQKLISGIREHLNGRLSNIQKTILLVLGYSYIAYEHTHPNKNSLNMLNRSQTWLPFTKLIIKKTFNKFFRGIKHNFKIFIYNN